MDELADSTPRIQHPIRGLRSAPLKELLDHPIDNGGRRRVIGSHD
jgi:hypothetical protein